MRILNIEDSLLLIIDVQGKLVNAVFNPDIVEKNAQILTNAASILNIPTFITEQYPKGLGNTISSVQCKVNNNTQFFEKTSFNAVFDINLLSALKKTGKKNVIIFGIETHICVYQTAISLLENDFCVHLVNNACGSRSEEESGAALNAMRDAGIFIKATEMVLFELLKSSNHPKFKEIQSLIK